MTRESAQTAILTSALIVGGTYAVRKLIEPAASQARKPAGNLPSAVLQVAGAEPSPAAVGQWATGFGFVYISLAIANTFAPGLAGSMAILVAVSNTIINGGAIFADVSGQVEGKSEAIPLRSGSSLPTGPPSGTIQLGHGERIGSHVGVTQSGQEHAS